MSTESQKPENVLAALELKKGSVAHIVKTSWEQSKREGIGPVKHFADFHLNLMGLLRFNDPLAFVITFGILADHVLPLLTDEEKEALRNESTNLEK